MISPTIKLSLVQPRKSSLRFASLFGSLGEEDTRDFKIDETGYSSDLSSNLISIVHLNRSLYDTCFLTGLSVVHHNIDDFTI